MAIGDDAVAAGYPILDGSTDLAKDGDDEINRTRDLLANLKVLVPTTKAGFRTAAGITSGTGDPTGGDNGDIYFKIIS
jgi:hypothetical protein